MVELYQNYSLKKEWIHSFLGAMESDLGQVSISSKNELEEYMYGSATVVGYMMCAIFGTRDKNQLYAAKMLAYSMQYINFIRDVDEDNLLGRKYLYDIQDIHYDTKILPDAYFKEFVLAHLKEYKSYSLQSKKGLTELPIPVRIPVMTARDMYDWTAKKIEKNPYQVFDIKIKPSKIHVILRGLFNSFREIIRSGISYFFKH